MIFIAPEAEDDLIAIHDFITAENPGAADRMIERLQRRCNSLANLPTREGVLLASEGRELRRLIEGPYLIIYVFEEPDVRIVRVLHGAMDILRVLRAPTVNEES